MKTYKSKGQVVVDNNIGAIDEAITYLEQNGYLVLRILLIFCCFL